ncbi:MAG: hypothetical protein AMS25_03155 [Gemmatimonas sp. SM23_52]|nr:MAG: hypothetical protein AMS25_03155 [Gemmatimonas sp. SM23_52]
MAAHNRLDAGAIAAMYAREPGITSVGDGEIVRGWDRVRERLDQVDEIRGAGGRLSLSTGSLDVMPLGQSHALVVTTYSVRLEVPESASVEEQGAMSLVLVKSDGEWQIVHDHTSARREDIAGAVSAPTRPGKPAQEPTTQSIADGRASEVAPAGYIYYTFEVPAGTCRVTGRIEGVSGGNKDFRALILDSDSFRNWSAGLQTRAWWQSGQVVVTTIDATVSGPGTYYLVIDNTFSVATAKTVQIWAQAACSAG